MTSTDTAITQIHSLPNLKKIASGKVREIFELNNDSLLFVATDRISAYDVIMKNGVPGKGKLLTEVSKFWFEMIGREMPGLKTHLISTETKGMGLGEVVEGRSMVVKKVPVVMLESIVRGYITGSAWSEYKKSGTVHGMKVREGMRESEKFAEPIWTPSTKAPAGEKDENISKEKAIALVGKDVAEKIEQTSLKIYSMAHDYAYSRGIIIADTKFEFGLDPTTKEIVLIDEVLTPDSSRFWPREGYEVGRGQASYDKQYLRDWLTSNGLKGKEGVEMPEEVVRETVRKYKEAREMLVGKEA